MDDPDIDLSLQPYSRAALTKALAGHECAHEREISLKQHVKYIEGYLKKINVKWMFVEPSYVDRDYIEDFSEHYARCFRTYNRFCSRIHFFSDSVDQTALRDALTSPDAKSVDEFGIETHYLGFLVVRPMPGRVIGRLCLRAYDRPGMRFPTLRRYKVNLFGLRLSVKSVAFQEQDKEVAACATSALWSAFHASALRFGHAAPSPVAITKSAVHLIHDVNRTIPSSGLTAWQQAAAIRWVGLEPYLIQVGRETAGDPDGSAARPHLSFFRAAVYAYLSGGLPCLISALYRSPAKAGADGATPDEGRHAVTALGYRLARDAPACAVTRDGPRLVGTRLDRLYVHDDQIGPFSKWKTEDPNVTTNWWFGDDEGKTKNVIPIHLLVPMYHKIRVGFDDIHTAVHRLNSVLRYALQALPEDLELSEPDWDIGLTTINKFRKELCQGEAETLLRESRRLVFLTRPLPRFLWRARAVVEGAPVFELLFDATDLSQGACLQDVLVFQPAYAVVAADIARRDSQCLKTPVRQAFRKLGEWSP